MADLNDVHKEVKSSIEAWEERTGEKKTPPYPADSPCYYCQFAVPNPGELLEVACSYCIHNPDAKVYELERENAERDKMVCRHCNGAKIGPATMLQPPIVCSYCDGTGSVEQSPPEPAIPAEVVELIREMEHDAGLLTIPGFDGNKQCPSHYPVTLFRTYAKKFAALKHKEGE